MRRAQFNAVEQRCDAPTISRSLVGPPTGNQQYSESVTFNNLNTISVSNLSLLCQSRKKNHNETVATDLYFCIVTYAGVEKYMDVELVQSVKDIVRIVHLPSVVQSEWYEAARTLFLRKENKNNNFIQQLVSSTSLSHCSAILERIHWTQTAYAVLCEPHHTYMLFSFKSKCK